MCLRTGEIAREQISAPEFRTTLGALARYLPGLSGIRFLYVPVELVVVLPTVFQCRDTRRWIFTGTLATQAVIVSATLTTPRAIRCLLRRIVTLRAWVVLTVKLAVLVPEPAEVVTLIGPVVAPGGTVALIVVAFTTLNVEATPLKVTLVAPVKFVPVIVTVVPTGPKVGVNEVIVGAPAVTLKFWELQCLPPGVVTQIFPVVAPVGTVAVIFVAEFTVKVAEAPPNVTFVAPVKFVPVIVTVVPTGPEVGEKEVIVGLALAVTVNAASLQAVPPGVVTQIFPVEAPDGTTAVIFVDEVNVKLAAMPLNVTLLTPVKFVPVIVTVVPTGPEVGEKEVIVGVKAAVTVKLWELVAVPSGVVTPIGPVVAPEGTVAVILVFEFTVNVAETPLNLTLVAPMRSLPLIVTDVPTGPLVGENEEIVGTAAHDGGAIAIAASVIPATIAARVRMALLRRPITGLPSMTYSESYRTFTESAISLLASKCRTAEGIGRYLSAEWRIPICAVPRGVTRSCQPRINGDPLVAPDERRPSAFSPRTTGREVVW